ncbi:hypothetical protein D1872_233060 [compost metagenome]
MDAFPPSRLGNRRFQQMVGNENIFNQHVSVRHAHAHNAFRNRFGIVPRRHAIRHVAHQRGGTILHVRNFRLQYFLGLQKRFGRIREALWRKVRQRTDGGDFVDALDPVQQVIHIIAVGQDGDPVAGCQTVAFGRTKYHLANGQGQRIVDDVNASAIVQNHIHGGADINQINDKCGCSLGCLNRIVHLGCVTSVICLIYRSGRT